MTSIRMTSLRYVLLLQRNLPRAVAFYGEGLGLQLRVSLYGEMG